MNFVAANGDSVKEVEAKPVTIIRQFRLTLPAHSLLLRANKEQKIMVNILPLEPVNLLLETLICDNLV